MKTIDSCIPRHIGTLRLFNETLNFVGWDKQFSKLLLVLIYKMNVIFVLILKESQNYFFKFFSGKYFDEWLIESEKRNYWTSVKKDVSKPCRTLEKYLLKKVLVFVLWKLKRQLSHHFRYAAVREVEKKISNIPQALIPIHNLITLLISVKPHGHLFIHTGKSTELYLFNPLLV